DLWYGRQEPEFLFHLLAAESLFRFAKRRLPVRVGACHVRSHPRPRRWNARALGAVRRAEAAAGVVLLDWRPARGGGAVADAGCGLLVQLHPARHRVAAGAGPAGGSLPAASG